MTEQSPITSAVPSAVPMSDPGQSLGTSQGDPETGPPTAYALAVGVSYPEYPLGFDATTVALSEDLGDIVRHALGLPGVCMDISLDCCVESGMRSVSYIDRRCWYPVLTIQEEQVEGGAGATQWYAVDCDEEPLLDDFEPDLRSALAATATCLCAMINADARAVAVLTAMMEMHSVIRREGEGR